MSMGRALKRRYIRPCIDIIFSILLLVVDRSLVSEAKQKQQLLSKATTYLSNRDFAKGGSCGLEGCRREAVSARAQIAGAPSEGDDKCTVTEGNLASSSAVESKNAATLEVFHWCRDTEGNSFLQGDGPCTYTVCADMSWDSDGVVNYTVTINHSYGTGSARAVSVQVYLNFDDEVTPLESEGDSICARSSTCDSSATACAGNATEVEVIAYDKHGGGWSSSVPERSTYWTLTLDHPENHTGNNFTEAEVGKAWASTLLEGHLMSTTKLCLMPGKYAFSSPASISGADNMSWAVCGTAGGASEAVNVTVNTGKCAVARNDVTIMASSISSPGMGDNEMCQLPEDDPCVVLSAQADGSPDVGVYHEPECASSPSEPGCGVGDVLEGADETCRFCIVNRDNWLESNPGEESDWPDCPCCVADTLGVVCVTTDDDGDQKSAMRNVGEAAVAVLMLACAVMVAICILAICLKSTTKQKPSMKRRPSSSNLYGVGGDGDDGDDDLEGGLRESVLDILNAPSIVNPLAMKQPFENAALGACGDQEADGDGGGTGGAKEPLVGGVAGGGASKRASKIGSGGAQHSLKKGSSFDETAILAAALADLDTESSLGAEQQAESYPVSSPEGSTHQKVEGCNPMFDPRRERTGLNSGSGASGGEGKSTSPGEPNEPDNTEQEFVQHPYGELVGPIDEHSVNGDDESTWSGDDRQDEFERMGELKEEMAMETEAETETEREPPPSAIPMRLQMAKVRTAPGMTKEEVRRANQERRDRVRGGEVAAVGGHVFKSSGSASFGSSEADGVVGASRTPRIEHEAERDERPSLPGAEADEADESAVPDSSVRGSSSSLTQTTEPQSPKSEESGTSSSDSGFEPTFPKAKDSTTTTGLEAPSKEAHPVTEEDGKNALELSQTAQDHHAPTGKEVEVSEERPSGGEPMEIAGADDDDADSDHLPPLTGRSTLSVASSCRRSRIRGSLPPLLPQTSSRSIGIASTPGNSLSTSGTGIVTTAKVPEAANVEDFAKDVMREGSDDRELVRQVSGRKTGFGQLLRTLSSGSVRFTPNPKRDMQSLQPKKNGSPTGAIMRPSPRQRMQIGPKPVSSGSSEMRAGRSKKSSKVGSRGSSKRPSITASDGGDLQETGTSRRKKDRRSKSRTPSSKGRPGPLLTESVGDESQIGDSEYEVFAPPSKSSIAAEGWAMSASSASSIKIPKVEATIKDRPATKLTDAIAGKIDNGGRMRRSSSLKKVSPGETVDLRTSSGGSTESGIFLSSSTAYAIPNDEPDGSNRKELDSTNEEGAGGGGERKLSIGTSDSAATVAVDPPKSTTGDEAAVDRKKYAKSSREEGDGHANGSKPRKHHNGDGSSFVPAESENWRVDPVVCTLHDPKEGSETREKRKSKRSGERGDRSSRSPHRHHHHRHQHHDSTRGAHRRDRSSSSARLSPTKRLHEALRKSRSNVTIDDGEETFASSNTPRVPVVRVTSRKDREGSTASSKGSVADGSSAKSQKKSTSSVWSLSSSLRKGGRSEGSRRERGRSNRHSDHGGSVVSASSRRTYDTSGSRDRSPQGGDELQWIRDRLSSQASESVHSSSVGSSIVGDDFKEDNDSTPSGSVVSSPGSSVGSGSVGDSRVSHTPERGYSRRSSRSHTPERGSHYVCGDSGRRGSSYRYATPDRSRSRRMRLRGTTPERGGHRGATPDRGDLRRKESEHVSVRATPERGRSRGMPDRVSIRGATPERGELRGTMPERGGGHRETPERGRGTRGTPDRVTLRGTTPERGRSRGDHRRSQNGGFSGSRGANGGGSHNRAGRSRSRSRDRTRSVSRGSSSRFSMSSLQRVDECSDENSSKSPDPTSERADSVFSSEAASISASADRVPSDEPSPFAPLTSAHLRRRDQNQDLDDDVSTDFGSSSRSSHVTCKSPTVKSCDRLSVRSSERGLGSRRWGTESNHSATGGLSVPTTPAHSARGSRGHVDADGTPAKGWREQAKIRKALVLSAAQAAQAKKSGATEASATSGASGKQTALSTQSIGKRSSSASVSSRNFLPEDASTEVRVSSGGSLDAPGIRSEDKNPSPRKATGVSAQASTSVSLGMATAERVAIVTKCHASQHEPDNDDASVKSKRDVEEDPIHVEASEDRKTKDSKVSEKHKKNGAERSKDKRSSRRSSGGRSKADFLSTSSSTDERGHILDIGGHRGRRRESRGMQLGSPAAMARQARNGGFQTLDDLKRQQAIGEPSAERYIERSAELAVDYSSDSSAASASASSFQKGLCPSSVAAASRVGTEIKDHHGEEDGDSMDSIAGLGIPTGRHARSVCSASSHPHDVSSVGDSADGSYDLDSDGFAPKPYRSQSGFSSSSGRSGVGMSRALTKKSVNGFDSLEPWGLHGFLGPGDEERSRTSIDDPKVFDIVEVRSTSSRSTISARSTGSRRTLKALASGESPRQTDPHTFYAESFEDEILSEEDDIARRQREIKRRCDERAREFEEHRIRESSKERSRERAEELYKDISEHGVGYNSVGRTKFIESSPIRANAV